MPIENLTQMLNGISITSLQADTTITTKEIIRLTEKIVAVKVNQTTLTLPINKIVYLKLLQALSDPTKLAQNMPLVFFVNEDGKAYQVMSEKLWLKAKAEANNGAH